MTNPNSAQSASKLVIRPENDVDADGITRVLIEAFGGNVEVDLVHALRNNGALTISFVACVSGEIVGHVAFSPMHADGQPDREDLLGLAPVAVLPKWQRRGIGATLVQRGLDECRRRGVAAVFVLGDPTFYRRFGFMPAHTQGFRCVYDAPNAFQLLALADEGVLPPAGLIRYRPEFDSLP
ncbi:MAG: N-acetyltransferase [Verrucomicrobiales bacterium]|nr:N-acetyltransferase [Verrucomicrobiales bacterium]